MLLELPLVWTTGKTAGVHWPCAQALKLDRVERAEWRGWRVGGMEGWRILDGGGGSRGHSNANSLTRSMPMGEGCVEGLEARALISERRRTK